MVVDAGKNNEKLAPGVADFMLKVGVTEVPMISYVQYAEGTGVVKSKAIVDRIKYGQLSKTQ